MTSRQRVHSQWYLFLNTPISLLKPRRFSCAEGISYINYVHLQARHNLFGLTIASRMESLCVDAHVSVLMGVGNNKLHISV